MICTAIELSTTSRGAVSSFALLFSGLDLVAKAGASSANPIAPRQVDDGRSSSATGADEPSPFPSQMAAGRRGEDRLPDIAPFFLTLESLPVHENRPIGEEFHAELADRLPVAEPVPGPDPVIPSPAST